MKGPARNLAGPLFFIRHPPDAGLTDAKLGAFDGFWQCQMLDAGLSCTQASDIARRGPKMRILLSSRRTSPLVFDRTQNNQALRVDTAAGCGRSAAIGRRMSPNKFLGMATSAIWNAT